MLGPFSRTFHSLFLSSNPLNARSRSSPSMAIALFSSILPFSSRCRCSRNSLWISAYNPSLFFDGNRFVAFRIWRYRRSVERRDDILCLLRRLLCLLLLLLGGGVTTRLFSKPYSFCRYTPYSCMVKRFGCYVKHQKKKKRKKKRRHHFCAPPSSSSFKRFFLCLFEESIKEEEEDERARTGTSKTLP